MDFIAGYLMGSAMTGRAGRYRAAAATMAEGVPGAAAQLDLDERIDRLAVVVEAMWAMLEEQGYRAEDLEAKIVELASQALEAPVESGMYCRQCEALVPRGMETCQFCGEPTGRGTVFGGLAT